MTRTAIAALGLFLTAAVFCAPVQADGYHVVVDADTNAPTGQVSGWPSHQNFTGKNPGNQSLLRGIRGAETNNHPCYLELLWSRQTAGEHSLFQTEWHREPCKDDQNIDKKVRLVNPPPEHVITAIRVCNNEKDNKRLKGIKITGVAELTADGIEPLSTTPVVDDFERTNCVPPYDSASACPAGQAAVGINIYHDAEGATGLELICGRVWREDPAASLIAVAPPNPPVLSPIAGTAGTKLRVMIGNDVDLPNRPRRDYGITSVMLEEAHDKPCRVVLFGGALDGDKGPDTRKLAEAKIAGCDPKIPIDTMHPSISGFSDQFLAGIEVCDSKNDNNDRIKGLKLRGALLREDGVRTLENTDQDLNPNCGIKSGLVECPEWSVHDVKSGMIAVGLEMHHDGEAFTGIQMICRDIESVDFRQLAEDAIGF